MANKGKSNKRKKKIDKKDIQKMNMQQLKKVVEPQTLAQLQEKAREQWGKALLSHFIVFNLFMDDEKMCHALFKIILKNFNINLRKLTITTEKSIEDKGKGVRLDVFVEEENNLIALEMQGKIKYMQPKRLRNYFVTIDKDQLIKGQKHTELKNTFIIVVTPEDPFGLDEPIYIVSKEAKPLTITKFEDGEFNLNDYTEDSFDLEKAKSDYNVTEIPEKPTFVDSLKGIKKTTEFDDGTYIIYLNASAYKKVENNELRAFLAYIMGEHLTEIDFFYVIHERFKKVKFNKKMELSYMLAAVKEYYYYLQLEDEANEKAKEKVAKITEEAIREAEEKAEEKAMKKAEKVIREANEKVEKAEEKVEKAEEKVEKAEEKVEKAEEKVEKAYQEKVNMVIEMINQNCLNDFIQIITKMPLEEIEKIRQDNSN